MWNVRRRIALDPSARAPSGRTLQVHRPGHAPRSPPVLAGSRARGGRLVPQRSGHRRRHRCRRRPRRDGRGVARGYGIFRGGAREEDRAIRKACADAAIHLMAAAQPIRRGTASRCDRAALTPTRPTTERSRSDFGCRAHPASADKNRPRRRPTIRTCSSGARRCRRARADRLRRSRADPRGRDRGPPASPGRRTSRSPAR